MSCSRNTVTLEPAAPRSRVKHSATVGVILRRIKGLRWRSQNTEKVTHVKGRLLGQAKILFFFFSSFLTLYTARPSYQYYRQMYYVYSGCSCVPFQMGTSLKGKKLLPEPVLKVWKITFTTLGELPSVLLFLLCTSEYCVMGDTPMDCTVSFSNDKAHL